MQNSLVLLALAVPAALLAVSLYWLDRVRRREALFHWANQKGFRLVHFRQPVLTEASPYPFSLSKSQQVFRVEVEARDGTHRQGWVRLGTAWLGLAARSADELWPDASRLKSSHGPDHE